MLSKQSGDRPRQRARRPSGVGVVARALAAAVVLLATIIGPVAADAGPTRLSDASVSDRSGTPTTSITFTVAYRNREGSPANWVRVVVAGSTHAMSLVAEGDWKREVRFRWTGKLPVGTHDVVFAAMSRDRFNDTLAAGTVTISPPPTPKPTPEPTPEPTPKPTAKPTPAPTPEPTPRPTLRPRPSATPTEAPTVEPRSTPRPTLRPRTSPSAAPTSDPTVQPRGEPGSGPGINPLGGSGPFGGPGASASATPPGIGPDIAPSLGPSGSPMPSDDAVAVVVPGVTGAGSGGE